MRIYRTFAQEERSEHRSFDDFHSEQIEQQTEKKARHSNFTRIFFR